MKTKWSASGEFMEACSCDYLCPCTPNTKGPATHEFCKVALTFVITKGYFAKTSLDGVRFVILFQTQEIMAQGGWFGGLIIDSSATDEQVEAIRSITSEQGGGPEPLRFMASLLKAGFRGIERHPVVFEKEGGNRRVFVDGLLDQSISGVESDTVPGDYLWFDNSPHPAGLRIALARAARNVINVFGIYWDGQVNKTNGHFAPFSWAGEAV